jgi:choline dehydrogenase
VQFILPK